VEGVYNKFEAAFIGPAGGAGLRELLGRRFRIIHLLHWADNQEKAIKARKSAVYAFKSLLKSIGRDAELAFHTERPAKLVVKSPKIPRHML
jgi:hypothetical protein